MRWQSSHLPFTHNPPKLTTQARPCARFQPQPNLCKLRKIGALRTRLQPGFIRVHLGDFEWLTDITTRSSEWIEEMRRRTQFHATRCDRKKGRKVQANNGKNRAGLFCTCEGQCVVLQVERSGDSCEYEDMVLIQFEENIRQIRSTQNVRSVLSFVPENFKL